MPPGCGLAATVSARPRVLSAAERVLGHPGAGLQVVVSPVNCKLLRARASPYQFVPVCPGHQQDARLMAGAFEVFVE